MSLLNANGHTNRRTKVVGQQARQFVLELQEHEDTFRHLIHDRDSKYTKAFDNVFRSEGINIIRTPVQAPNANAYAERFV